MTRGRQVALVLVAAALAALAWAASALPARLSAPPSAPPAACAGDPRLPRFCVDLPSFGPPQRSAPPLGEDQVRPCGQAAAFRPAFCIALPAGGDHPDRAALLEQRRDACESLSRAEAPEVCFVVPSSTATDAALERQAALVLLRQRLGTDFRRVGGGALELWAERGVADADAAGVDAILGGDLAAVEAYFGRPFTERPAVFLFASQGSFAAALERQFGYATSVSRQLADQYGGILVSGIDAIAINAQNVLAGPRPTIFRHELTHVMAHQLAGATLPLWFDEGLAALVAAPDPDAFDSGRATALSILGEAALAPVAFDESRSWADRNTALEGNAYGVAAEALRLVADQLGRAGLTALLEDAARRGSFASAFAAAAGEPLAQFVAQAPDRATAACRHGIGLAATRPDGLVVWWIHGFGPAQRVDITVDGPARYAFTVTTDRFGVYTGTVGRPMPDGAYHLTATRGGAAVSAAVELGAPQGAGRVCG